MTDNPATEAPAPTVGTCLNSSMTAMPCTALHRSEVVAVDATSCDAKTAIDYVGGNRNLDVLRAKFELVNGTCLVSEAADTNLTASIAGLFAQDAPAADPFRLCRDDRVGPKEVSCDVPHTGEAVGVEPGLAPDQAGCETAASAYMGVTFGRVSDRLKVIAVQTADPHDGKPRCFIAVRGNEVLTESLRNLKTSALPMIAG